MGNPRFDRLLSAVAGKGHPDNPLLHPSYSPSSRVPCTGLVEWMSVAWKEADFEAIEYLLSSIGVCSQRAIQATRKSLSDGSIACLDPSQLAALGAAYVLQGALEGSYSEFVLTDRGRSDLMAASILPWDFEVREPQRCIAHVNNFILDMREDTPYWEEVELFEESVLNPYQLAKHTGLSKILSRMEMLSTAARMHLIDSVVFSKKDRLRPIGDSTFYDTRRFGCNVEETSAELFASGLINRQVCVDRLTGCFSKDELVAVLKKQNVRFKTSTRKGELWSLVLAEAQAELINLAMARGYYSISSELEQRGTDLLSLLSYQSLRLRLWAAGILAPPSSE